MPTYEYECKGCNKKFSVILSISEHETTKVSCPKCKGKRVKQSLSTFTTIFRKAQESNQDPQAYCDIYAKRFEHTYILFHHVVLL